MDAADQVIFLLKVALNIAPVAVYFLVLGQVNSQSQPVVVNARADFLILTLVFVPLLAWPVPFLVQTGHERVLLAGLLIAAGGFRWLLPGRHSGWVVYNVSQADGWEMLHRAVTALGWSSRRSAQVLDLPACGVQIEVTSFALLRNVTFRVVPAPQAMEAERFAALEAQLRREVGRFSLLPSAAGGCLMVLGVSLMIVPLWLMSQHIDAIVEIVHRLLFA